MIDAFAKKILDPGLISVAAVLSRFSITANQLSFLGFLSNAPLLYCLCHGKFLAAVGFILFNRACDGLDGSIARLANAPRHKAAHKGAATTMNKKTKANGFLGGFIDISNDYVFYGIVPLGFAIYDPPRNSLASVFLLFGFLMTAVSFLGAAILHEKWQSQKNQFQKTKGFFYSFGIMEGVETIAFFIIACLAPLYYPWLAMLVTAICLLTAAVRFVGLVMVQKNNIT